MVTSGKCPRPRGRWPEGPPCSGHCRWGWAAFLFLGACCCEIGLLDQMGTPNGKTIKTKGKKHPKRTFQHFKQKKVLETRVSSISIQKKRSKRAFRAFRNIKSARNARFEHLENENGVFALEGCKNHVWKKPKNARNARFEHVLASLEKIKLRATWVIVPDCLSAS